MRNIIYWNKIDNNAAIIPTKRDEDAGYDIYTVEDNIILWPHETRLFKTGIRCIINGNIWLKAMDRGSTGSKGIHCHCGVIDKGYRGEIFICLNNTNNYPVKFTSQIINPYLATRDFYFDQEGHECCGEIFYYPISKGIAQLIPVEMPDMMSCEINEDCWKELNKEFSSQRGDTKLGASGK